MPIIRTTCQPCHPGICTTLTDYLVTGIGLYNPPNYVQLALFQLLFWLFLCTTSLSDTVSIAPVLCPSASFATIQLLFIIRLLFLYCITSLALGRLPSPLLWLLDSLPISFLMSFR